MSKINFLFQNNVIRGIVGTTIKITGIVEKATPKTYAEIKSLPKTINVGEDNVIVLIPISKHGKLSYNL